MLIMSFEAGNDRQRRRRVWEQIRPVVRTRNIGNVNIATRFRDDLCTHLRLSITTVCKLNNTCRQACTHERPYIKSMSTSACQSHATTQAPARATLCKRFKPTPPPLPDPALPKTASLYDFDLGNLANRPRSSGQVSSRYVRVHW